MKGNKGMKFGLSGLIWLIAETLLVECGRAVEALPQQPLLKRDTVIAAAREVTAEKYPDADSAMVDDAVSVAYREDGTDETWDDEYVKVLTEKGRRSVSVLTLGFNDFYGSVRVVKAEIIKADGRVIDIDVEKNSRVMIDSGQMKSNIYDPRQKRMTLSIPGLEVGDIRHVLVCRETQKTRMPDAWFDYQTFEADVPIIQASYSVSVPSNRPLARVVLRSPITNTVTTSVSQQADGRTLHTWRVKNVPQMFPEPAMPVAYTVVQRLLLSTVPDWRAVSRWYWKLCEKPLSDVTPEMREKVAELIKDAKTRDEKTRAIFKFVSQQIRYMGVTTETVAPGYEPHNVSVTFRNRYGVCRDKAALLVAMLRLADIPAYPVLINVGPKIDEEIPLPYFNHAITAAVREDGTVDLMDSTNESTLDLFPAYLGNCSYLVASEEGDPLRVSPVYPAEKELVRITTKGGIDETGTATFKSSLQFDGINDDAYRSHFLRIKKEQRRVFFEKILKARLSGAEVMRCEILPENLQDTATPLSVEVAYRVPHYPVRGEKLDTLPLPWLGTAFGYVNFVVGQTGLKERKYPYQTEIACGVEERVILNLRDGMKSDNAELPPVKSIDRGHVEFVLSMEMEGQLLKARRQYLVKTVEFSPEEYQVLKGTLEEIEEAGKFCPLFPAKGKNLVPDEEVLYDRVETVLGSERDWSSIHTWSKRILSYNGTKKAAEVKINYNPVWQSLELVSAVVSNTNGKVFQAGKQEIHQMDASWVASAPRYPAAKQMVVNLPGVEIGSVITVTTRFRQIDSPFYSRVSSFGGFTPIGEESYSLTVPNGLTPKFQTYNFDTMDTRIETNDSGVVYMWTDRNREPLKTESSLPPWHFFQPTLYLTFGDWKTYAGEVSEAFDRVLSECEAASAKAKELTAKATSEREKILAIRNEIMRTIRVAGPGFLELPFSTLSAPDRTLADRYGHAADRALLMLAMLRAVGCRAEIVLASTDSTRYPRYRQPTRDYPQHRYFREPIVRVYCGNETYYLNEGTQYSELGPSDIDGAYVLKLDGTIETVEVPEKMKDRDREEMTVDLDAQGLATITVTNWFFGTSVGTFRQAYKEILPEDLRRHTLEVVGALAKSAEPDSPLISETDAYPGYQTFRAKVPHYAILQGNRMTLRARNLLEQVFPLREDTRENPIFLSEVDVSEFVYRVLFPKGFTSFPILPRSFSWDLPNGVGSVSFRVEKTTTPEGRCGLTITRTLKRASGMLPAELYPAVLEYNRLMTHPTLSTIVAEREGEK
ncbi:MAG: DUF3857 domain-containing protein [Kiritimatiellae bacterium]|nr:DUF3857 domain-containing protein [Kiritimatiellia bacterium]